MRIAHTTLYDTTQYRLGQLVENLHGANKVVASGKRINSAADDPVGITQVLDLKSKLSHLDQLKQNISTGKSWLSNAETALKSVKDIIVDTRVLAIAMLNGAVNASERASAAQQVHESLLQLQDLANTTINGQYVFAGTKTDTMPFVLDDLDNPTAVTYNGNDKGFAIKISKDSAVEVGLPGQPLFEDLYYSLMDLKGYLETDDTAGINTSLTELDSRFENIITTVSDIGSRTIRLEVKEKIIADMDLSYQTQRTEIEEADILEAISALQAREFAYHVALNSSAKLMKLSLADYL